MKEKSKQCHNIQHLQPLESCGPSNHRSHSGFMGPWVLQTTKNRDRRMNYFFKLFCWRQSNEFKEKNRDPTVGEEGLVLSPHCSAFWQVQKTAISQMNWRFSYFYFKVLFRMDTQFSRSEINIMLTLYILSMPCPVYLAVPVLPALEFTMLQNQSPLRTNQHQFMNPSI